MKSIKPGRQSSMMSVLGSIIGIIFILGWIGTAITMGAPFFFPLFGVCMLVIIIIQGTVAYKNTTSKNRYSLYDIVDEKEESDPLNDRFKRYDDFTIKADTSHSSSYCPECGKPTSTNDKYCRNCGKKL